jgi:hypothetical protein
VSGSDSEQPAGRGQTLREWARERKAWLMAALAAAVAASISAVVVDAVQSGVATITGPREPFGWTISAAPGATKDTCGQHLVNRPPAQMRVDHSADVRLGGAWWRSLGAVDADATDLRITVQGHTSKAVVLHGFKVKVTKRSMPLAANAYDLGELNPCGEGVSPRGFAIELDAPQPRARALPGPTPQPAVDFPYRISESDPEVFEVTATTARCDCSWHLELDWSSDGVSGTSVITVAGRDFRTSSSAGRPRYEYRDGGWQRHS